MSAGSHGSNVAAGSSRISGIDEVFELMLGVPQAAASSTGSPKPSSSDGCTASTARCINSTTSARVAPTRTSIEDVAP